MAELSTPAVLERVRSQRARQGRLRADLDNVEGDIAACERILSMFEKPEPKKRTRRQAYTNVTADELRGMGVETALILIADKNNDQLKSTPGRALLVAAGVLDEENAKHALHEALKESRHFEPAGERGRWRTISPSRAALKAV